LSLLSNIAEHGPSLSRRFVSTSCIANKLVSLASDERKLTQLEALRTIVTLIEHGDEDLVGLATTNKFMLPLCHYLLTGLHGDVNVIGRVLGAIDRLLLFGDAKLAKRHMEENHGMAYLEVLLEHRNPLIFDAVQRVLSHFKDDEESPGRGVHSYSSNSEVEHEENEQAHGSSPPPSKQLFPLAPVVKSPQPPSSFGHCNYDNMEL
jgi:hypothetical protein